MKTIPSITECPFKGNTSDQYAMVFDVQHTWRKVQDSEQALAIRCYSALYSMILYQSILYCILKYYIIPYHVICHMISSYALYTCIIFYDFCMVHSL